MYGKEGGDVYATGEVYEAFDRRIRFLLELKMKSVKVRYLPAPSFDVMTDDAGTTVDEIPSQCPFEGIGNGRRSPREGTRIGGLYLLSSVRS